VGTPRSGGRGSVDQEGCAPVILGAGDQGMIGADLHAQTMVVTRRAGRGVMLALDRRSAWERVPVEEGGGVTRDERHREQ
jgi:hypothetical protein